jgi:hypothetical protein
MGNVFSPCVLGLLQSRPSTYRSLAYFVLCVLALKVCDTNFLAQNFPNNGCTCGTFTRLRGAVVVELMEISLYTYVFVIRQSLANHVLAPWKLKWDMAKLRLNRVQLQAKRTPHPHDHKAARAHRCKRGSLESALRVPRLAWAKVKV